jgi:hypothetical protein
VVWWPEYSDPLRALGDCLFGLYSRIWWTSQDHQFRQYCEKKKKEKKKNRKSQKNAISVPFRFVLWSKITDGTVDPLPPFGCVCVSSLGCVCVVCCLLCVCCVSCAHGAVCSVLCALCCQLCVVCVGPGDSLGMMDDVIDNI